MNSDEHRGNITLDEVKKIIFLSTKLTTFTPHSKYSTPATDNYGRLIINNKYKILDEEFNNYSL